MRDKEQDGYNPINILNQIRESQVVPEDQVSDRQKELTKVADISGKVATFNAQRINGEIAATRTIEFDYDEGSNGNVPVLNH